MGSATMERPTEALRARVPQAQSVLLYTIESIGALDDLDELRSAVRMVRRELRAVEALLDEKAI